MILIFGSRLYGQVDKVPGLGYVATQFAHLWYIPLVPFQSWFVVAEEGSQWRGLQVPMSGRSVLAGYARVWLVLAMAVAAIIGAATFVADRETGIIALAIAVAMLVLTISAFRGWREASPMRIRELHAMLGVQMPAVPRGEMYGGESLPLIPGHYPNAQGPAPVQTYVDLPPVLPPALPHRSVATEEPIQLELVGEPISARGQDAAGRKT